MCQPRLDTTHDPNLDDRALSQLAEDILRGQSGPDDTLAQLVARYPHTHPDRLKDILDGALMFAARD